MQPNQIATPKAMSASGVARDVPGGMVGILCTVSSSAVLNVYDHASAANGTKFIDTLTLVAGAYYTIPAGVANGIYVELVSGTGKWTVFHA